MTNVRLDKFGQCHKIHYPNEVVEEDEDLLEIEHEVEDEEDDIDDEEYIARKEAAEIHCIAPDQRRFAHESFHDVCADQRDGNNVLYNCEGGTQLCW